jgi:hypothetical protein
MLYQQRVLGRSTLLQRLAARLALRRVDHKGADLDLAALGPHLSRDLGLWDGQAGLLSRRLK